MKNSADIETFYFIILAEAIKRQFLSFAPKCNFIEKLDTLANRYKTWMYYTYRCFDNIYINLKIMKFS